MHQGLRCLLSKRTLSAEREAWGQTNNQGRPHNSAFLVYSDQHHHKEPFVLQGRTVSSFFMINFCQTKHAAYIVYAVCVTREKRNGQMNNSTFAFAEARVTEKASSSRHSPPLEFLPAFSILIWFIVKTLESGEGLLKQTLLKSFETKQASSVCECA